MSDDSNKDQQPVHKSGFVNIIGRPNVGKSTLMNALVGERMSIITAKPQTTRHRIIGLLSDENFQIVFSDTPGIIGNPAYRMQELMNQFAHSTFEDADVMLFVTEAEEVYQEDDPLITRLKKFEGPRFLVINKIDKAAPEKIKATEEWWTGQLSFTEVIAISALQKTNTDDLLAAILRQLPVGPAYYPKDQLTDRPERFFVSEIIREKILELYHEEIPYACEVAIAAFKEKTTVKQEPIVEIQAVIFVERETQKMILLGRKGSSIKKLGTAARLAIEEWLQQKVFLDLHVKVREKWRNDERLLRHFGYD